MTARKAPQAPVETKINVWLNVAAIIVPALFTVCGGLIFVGSLTATIKDQIAAQSKDVDLKIQPITSGLAAVSAKVDGAAKDAQNKVESLSQKVDAANATTQLKQDSLANTFERNLADQQSFRSNVQAWIGKVSDAQQKLADQLTQERVDRLTETAKKK